MAKWVKKIFRQLFSTLLEWKLGVLVNIVIVNVKQMSSISNGGMERWRKEKEESPKHKLEEYLKILWWCNIVFSMETYIFESTILLGSCISKCIVCRMEWKQMWIRRNMMSDDDDQEEDNTSLSLSVSYSHPMYTTQLTGIASNLFRSLHVFSHHSISFYFSISLFFASTKASEASEK